MSKHTPGPWEVVYEPRLLEHAGAVYRVGKPGRFKGDHEILASVHVLNGEREPADANARLIAAAPELAEVLNEARVLLEIFASRGNGDGGDTGRVAGRALGALRRAGVLK